MITTRGLWALTTLAGSLVAQTANAQQIFDPNLITLRHDFETEPPEAPPDGPFTLGNATFSEFSTGSGDAGWRLISVWPGMGRQLTDDAGITEMHIVFDVAMTLVGLNVGIGPATYDVNFMSNGAVVGTVSGTLGSVEENFFAGWEHAGGIDEVIITEPSGENGLVGGIDDVRYDAVPEPATIVALGVGLAVLASRRRR
ncbi:MAG: PEP-CTERM sorting domain-containing protein [Armatimonadetes bacterium]|nr:PEP-CTERM sorting domain-containing protein [Armatimonadota bacterium]